MQLNPQLERFQAAEVPKAYRSSINIGRRSAPASIYDEAAVRFDYCVVCCSFCEYDILYRRDDQMSFFVAMLNTDDFLFIKSGMSRTQSNAEDGLVLSRIL